MLEKEQSICKESRKRKIVKVRTEIKELKAKVKPNLDNERNNTMGKNWESLMKKIEEMSPISNIRKTSVYKYRRSRENKEDKMRSTILCHSFEYFSAITGFLYN